MLDNISVSVICNAFNHEKYIRDALEGFVSQKTNFNFEVLIHDDASTDKTADIIREYEEKYPEIIKPIYQSENQFSKGVKINRVYQAPRVKGKYVAFCEGDDYWTDPLKLQKQYDFMENNPDYSMCACSTVWLDMKTEKSAKKCCVELDKDISIEDIIIEKKGRVFQYATFFLKTEIYTEIPKWYASFGVGDLPTTLYAAICGKIRMLSDVMAVYRFNSEGSWTSRMSNIENRKKAMMKMIDGYSGFNVSTEYKYDDLVQKRIKMIKYNLARRSGDIKTLKSEELKEIYNSKDFAHRMSDCLMCKFPRLHSYIMKFLG